MKAAAAVNKSTMLSTLNALFHLIPKHLCEVKTIITSIFQMTLRLRVA